jgi:twitching motility protein pilT
MAFKIALSFEEELKKEFNKRTVSIEELLIFATQHDCSDLYIKVTEYPYLSRYGNIYRVPCTPTSKDVWSTFADLYVSNERNDGYVHNKQLDLSVEVYVPEDKLDKDYNSKYRYRCALGFSEEKNVATFRMIKPKKITFDNITYPADCKDMLHKALKNKDGIIIFSAPTGSGKAVLDTTLIPVADDRHYVQIKDIKVGDLVYNRLGSPVNVIGVYPQGKKDVYRVNFTDGRYLDCCKDHLFSYYTQDQKTKYAHDKYNTPPKFNVSTVEELLNRGIGNICGNRLSLKYWIPNNQPIEREEQDYYLNPYVLGVLIGDGCLTERQLTISSNDSFIVEKVSSLLNVENIVKRSSIHTYSWYFVISDRMYEKRNKLVSTVDVLSEIPELDNMHSYEKFIPDIYKYGSIEQRYKLLQGLFDTDGTVDKHRARVSFSTTSKHLVDDIQEVLWSLGISSTVEIDNRLSGHHKHISYTLYVRTSFQIKKKLFTLPRKLNRIIDYEEYHKNTDKKVRTYDFIGIQSIEKLDKQEDMTCICVDDTEHLYQVSNQYIVTHNSSTMAACINTFSQKGDVLDNTVWSTLEDPIEYRFESTDSFKITQKEMGEDFREFADGIKVALREHPNCILVGEIRDKYSISSAIEASRTGHLTMTTFHADDVAGTLRRLLYHLDNSSDLTYDLIANMRCIVSQHLIPQADRYLVDVEYLYFSPTIKRTILNGLKNGDNINSIIDDIMTNKGFIASKEVRNWESKE